ncbi:MAG: hypothetical protein QXN23_06590 [Candidatus Caldarchaeum sp.]
MIEMEAQKKLEGAKYHFQRMEETYSKNEKHFTYELEAFLVKLRSVPDVLLQDFNEKFSLNINLEEKLDPKTFKERAEKMKNGQAIAFIQWWKENIDRMRSDKRGSILFSKRNISVHRKVLQPNLKKVNVFETITVTESIKIVKYDEEGRLVEEWKSPETPPKPREVKPTEIEINLFFSEYPEENVLEVCRMLLEMIEKFVEEAKNRFN